jgi:hypothetical protein
MNEDERLFVLRGFAQICAAAVSRVEAGAQPAAARARG